MSNDMKLIMENWRSSYVLSETKKDLFEDIEYIQEVLGVEVPLNENNEPVLSEEIKNLEDTIKSTKGDAEELSRLDWRIDEMQKRFPGRVRGSNCLCRIQAWLCAS